MNDSKEWQERLINAKNKKLSPGRNIRSDTVGDRTIFNVHAQRGEYKLAQAYASVRNLDFIVEQDRKLKLQTFKEYGDWLKKMKWPLKIKFLEKPRPKFPADEKYRDNQSKIHYSRGEMLVLVANSIYAAIAASIDQYVLDVARDGYWARVFVVLGGQPSEIRNFIHKERPVGALLVGAIPAPWYELDDDFHGVHSEFPCDLYYMDTDGVWTDPDNDGKFSGHDGNVNPEIWIGRIWSPTSGGNDVKLINDYFARNHKFRTGQLGHARSALAYVDDDWQGFDDCEFDQLFPTSLITKYTNPVITDADLYKAEVNSMRSWVQLCAHSSPHSHAFKVGNTNEHINTAYFRDVNPPNSHFYNLFCCGPGRYTEDDYLAGWYIFDKPGHGTNCGLTAVASSKSGSMLWFADFYRPLGQGKVIGDAFVEWWKARGPNHELDEIRWHYGLALLGDPTLSWWKGAVPRPEQPEDGDTFDQFPRKMEFRWDPVNIPGAIYTVEIDAFGAINVGNWAEATGQSFAVYHNIAGITHQHNFVGMQRGRWRVRAKIGGQFCSWSPWSYFKYTV